MNNRDLAQLNSVTAPHLARGRKIADEVLSAWKRAGGVLPGKIASDARTLVTLAASLAFVQPFDAEKVEQGDAALKECIELLGINNNLTTRQILMHFAEKIAALQLPREDNRR